MKCRVCGREITTGFLWTQNLSVCQGKCSAIQLYRMKPKRYLAGTHIPSIFAEASIDDTIGQYALAHGVCITGKIGPHGGLLIGDLGTGKSFVAAQLLLLHIFRGECIEPSATGEIKNLGAGWTEADGYAQALRHCQIAEREALVVKNRNIRALVLDDLGSEYIHEDARIELETILKHRYHAQHWTIVTMNGTFEDLERDRPRLASRFAALGVMRFTGPDLRLADKQEKTK